MAGRRGKSRFKDFDTNKDRLLDLLWGQLWEMIIRLSDTISLLGGENML